MNRHPYSHKKIKKNVKNSLSILLKRCSLHINIITLLTVAHATTWLELRKRGLIMHKQMFVTSISRLNLVNCTSQIRYNMANILLYFESKVLSKLTYHSDL